MIYSLTSVHTASLKSEWTGEILLKIEGKATFLRLPMIAEVIERIPSGTTVLFDVTDLTFIDHACLDLLIAWNRQHLATGGTVSIDWDALISLYRQKPVEPHIREKLLAVSMSQ
jgi:MFS superfamily sulfate permease-like transporter